MGKGDWQKLIIEKRGGDGPILPNDLICFRAHTGKYVHAQDAVLRAVWNECGDWQSMQIEREVVNAVFSGHSIHLLGHTGKRIEVEGTAVQARWAETGTWQTFTIENLGGRAIFSGDAVFLKSHTSAMVDVQDSAVQAMWNDKGGWQQLHIHKKHGSGVIMPGDSIFLQAHTGNLIDVEGTAVQARWSDKGDWQTLVIEKATKRRLSDSSVRQEAQQDFVSVTLRAFLLLVVMLASLAAMMLWRRNRHVNCKVQPADCVDLHFIAQSQC